LQFIRFTSPVETLIVSMATALSPRAGIARLAQAKPAKKGQMVIVRSAARSELGDKLLPMLRTPADVLALGPRVALGALSSLPDGLQKL
jgi:hypothetical protein